MSRKHIYISLLVSLCLLGCAAIATNQAKCTPPSSGGKKGDCGTPTSTDPSQTKSPSSYAQKKSSLEGIEFMPKESFWNNPYYHISPGKEVPEYVTALIEIPKGSRAKFEIDSESGLIRLDRVLYNAIHYPSHYGFIPQTMTGDRDPLDILVLCSEHVPPMTLIEARVIGIIQMIDGDEEDDKIIAVARGDPKFDHVKDIDGVSIHTISEIEHFFEDYKRRIGIEVILEEFQGKEQAYESIREALKYYAYLKDVRQSLKQKETKK